MKFIGNAPSVQAASLESRGFVVGEPQQKHPETSVEKLKENGYIGWYNPDFEEDGENMLHKSVCNSKDI